LQRTFKALTGITPRAYADSRRLNSLKAGLREGHSVTRSLYDAGYGSSSRLYERASSQLGMTPSRYRKQGAGETIHYTVASTPIGKMLLAATERGICSIQFSDSAATLERRLHSEFPKAEIVHSDRKLAGQVKALCQVIQGEATAPLPLDIQATAFQRRVWEELQAIPRGATKSYSKVAAEIGYPRAAQRWRALARRIRLRLPFHAIVWCARMAQWAAIAGAWIARKSCSRWKPSKTLRGEFVLIPERLRGIAEQFAKSRVNLRN